ncbi:MAG: glycosyltransferase, partial [Rhizobiaceae bacterium]|nr:glycosyltransferase [Rhizobiaceae bacterium]
AACGRAIVTTDVPGCRAFVRDGIDGLVVRPGDANALAAAFEALSVEPERVARMGASARARVLEHHTEDHVVEVLERLYRECLDA